MPFSTLEKALRSIELDAQYSMAFLWTKKTLPIWNRFTGSAENLIYTDSNGKKHKVNVKLVDNAIEAVESQRAISGSDPDKFNNAYEELAEHVTSIDCLDWELSNDVERMFCAVFNLMQLYRKHFIDDDEEAQLNMVINQAADALLSGSIKTLDELNEDLLLIKKFHGKTKKVPKHKPDQPAAQRDLD